MQQYGKNFKQAYTIEVETSQVFREPQVDQWVSRTKSTKNLLYEFQHTRGPSCWPGPNQTYPSSIFLATYLHHILIAPKHHP